MYVRMQFHALPGAPFTNIDYNFHPSMGEQSHIYGTQKSVGWNYLSIPKLQLLKFGND